MNCSIRGEPGTSRRKTAPGAIKALSGALALGGVLLFWPAAAPGQELSDARIVTNFDIIALRAEYRRLTDPRIVRWAGPIRIYIERDVAIEPLVEDDLRAHLARLERLTGIEMDYVDVPAEANFHIVYTQLQRFPHYIRRFTSATDAQLRAVLQRADCVGFFNARRDSGEITRAAAVIPVDHARERGILYACAVEETTQVMGLPNDSDEVMPSIFNDSTITEDLTWQDELLVRLLYHPLMRPGMPRDQALTLARQLVPQLRR